MAKDLENCIKSACQMKVDIKKELDLLVEELVNRVGQEIN